MSAISELSSLRRGRLQTAEERRQRRKEEKKDNLAGYLFLTPWLIGLFAITIGPMLASLYLAFTDYNLIQPPEWIGLANFEKMLTDERLHKSLAVTFKYVIVGVPLQLIMALGVALLLDKGMRGLPFSRRSSPTSSLSLPWSPCATCTAFRIRCSWPLINSPRS